jgi:hypothetical protein
MVLFIRKLKFCLFKFSFCFVLVSNFRSRFCCVNGKMIEWCDHKAITLWNGFQVWNNSWKMFFVRPLQQSIWDSLFIFVMLTKCCIFAIKTELWLLSKLFISSVSGEYRNFLLRKLWVFEFLCDSNIGR